MSGQRNGVRVLFEIEFRIGTVFIAICVDCTARFSVGDILYIMYGDLSSVSVGIGNVDQLLIFGFLAFSNVDYISR